MKIFAASLLLLSACAASGRVTAVTKEQIEWKQAAGLPPGMMSATEWGDPEKGPYQVLVRFPAGTQVAPHYHRYDEFATVASGCVIFGQGETVDESRGVEVSAGGYVTIPAHTAHWARCVKDAVVVRFGPGPRELTPIRAGEKAPGSQPLRIVQAKDVPWQDAPGMVNGVKTVLQYGDPEKGPYIILLKFPKGLVNPPHWHTADEAVTILSGEMITGEGKTIDDRTGLLVPAGGYFIIPGHTAHWGKVKEEVVLTRLGNGPRDIYYFNPK